MFGRRSKRGGKARFRQWLWPVGGIRRSGQYMIHRLARTKASPYSLAAGFACGAAVSFTPLVGLHFVAAGLLALCMRASVIASAVGTIVGNPWTFPFIWLVTYEAGRWLGFGGGVEGERIDFVSRFQRACDALWNLDLGGVAHAAGPILEPMMVGGSLIGVAVWLAFFLLLFPVIGAYKRTREVRLQSGRARRSAALSAGAKG
ncbi:uncharacterized protein (DUF2062 family) [Constrictibacter sp. MBR-5]|jgi:uncharacterized protein (DUF2062 family)|uniref:DUF2062 domain-containing protein n=1 Tax=Constrictibacter sp. MBR-5 TaxID=3156467 RepID=UPI003391A7B9